MKYKVTLITLGITLLLGMHIMDAMDAPSKELANEDRLKASPSGKLVTAQQALRKKPGFEMLHLELALGYGVMHGDVDRVRLLLGAGTDPEYDTWMLLYAVTKVEGFRRQEFEAENDYRRGEYANKAEPYEKILRALLEYGADIQDGMGKDKESCPLAAKNTCLVWPHPIEHMRLPYGVLARLLMHYSRHELDLIVLFCSFQNIEKFLFPDDSLRNSERWRLKFWGLSDHERQQELEKAFLLAVGQARVEVVELLLKHSIFVEAAVENVSMIIGRLERKNALDERIARYHKILRLLIEYRSPGASEESTQTSEHEIRVAYTDGLPVVGSISSAP